MTALTLRKIPFMVEKAIRSKASRKHISLNKAVVELLEDSVGGRQKKQVLRYHDLDWMCGVAAGKDSAKLSKHLTETRKIDPELWQ